MTEYVLGSMAWSKGEEGGALSCVGGPFRLGFGKQLQEHVATPNTFHPLLPGDCRAPSVVDGTCGQNAASLSLSSLLLSLLPQRLRGKPTACSDCFSVREILEEKL